MGSGPIPAGILRALLRRNNTRILDPGAGVKDRGPFIGGDFARFAHLSSRAAKQAAPSRATNIPSAAPTSRPSRDDLGIVDRDRAALRFPRDSRKLRGRGDIVETIAIQGGRASGAKEIER